MRIGYATKVWKARFNERRLELGARWKTEWYGERSTGEGGVYSWT